MMEFISKSEEVDVAVIGCGPGGLTLATLIAESGRRVLALERAKFPRYHIGESLTGTAGDMLRRLHMEPALEKMDAVEKSGVKVIGRDSMSEFFVPVLRPTWQVDRAAFDAALMERAREVGVLIREGSARYVLRDGSRVSGLVYQPSDQPSVALHEVKARVVVDASGHSAFLSQQCVAGPRRVDAFARQIATFAQFKNVRRDPGAMGNNTFIYFSEPLHWAWMIPVTSEVTSVGVVLPASTFSTYGANPQDVLSRGLHSINPELAERMAGARPKERVRVIRNYSYRVDPFVGDGWLCIGDAHRFVDPIFSFGVSMAMSEAEIASTAIRQALATGNCERPFQQFAQRSNAAQDVASDLIRYFWKFPAFFGYQTRGRLRKDFIRLLAGDVFEQEDMPAVVSMRKSLHDVPLGSLREGKARDIARRVHQRYAHFQGVEAAYIAEGEDGVCLSFVLSDEDVDLYEALSDFEEDLYDDFGRDDLAVVSYTPKLASALKRLAPHMSQGFSRRSFHDEGHRIFDRRAS